MSNRILVVDDDADIRQMLASTLAFAGFTVRTVGDVASGMAELLSDPPDAIVLDVMMPNADGFEFVQLVRRRDTSIPVLFLSARDGLEDRVRGLRLGGDDYVTKPFSVVEVVARLEALLRRTQPSAAPLAVSVLECADRELDEDRHRVSRGGDTIELSATEYRLLKFLLQNRGRVLSKGQILDHVWQYDFGGDANVVERFVSNLRRKIDDGRVPLIHTIRGFGYSIREPEPQ